WRPAFTGWFADYADLHRPAGSLVGYSDVYMAFMGATQDPSGLYRFNAIWDLFRDLNLTVANIHSHVLELQKAFINDLHPGFSKRWQLTEMFDRNLKCHGHFLTFKAQSEKAAEECQESLRKSDILIDRRGTRLR